MGYTKTGKGVLDSKSFNGEVSVWGGSLKGRPQYLIITCIMSRLDCSLNVFEETLIPKRFFSTENYDETYEDDW